MKKFERYLMIAETYEKTILKNKVLRRRAETSRLGAVNH